MGQLPVDRADSLLNLVQLGSNLAQIRVGGQCKLESLAGSCKFLLGLGTFRPIEVDDYTQHPMHREWGELPQSTVDAIARCRQRGGRVVAVGTTAVRVLETAAQFGPLASWSGETELFIYPPYEFSAVDALITNFHLPRTTLLLLVAAFAGPELTNTAYRTAIAEGYRFYSYGDAMLIL